MFHSILWNILSYLRRYVPWHWPSHVHRKIQYYVDIFSKVDLQGRSETHRPNPRGLYQLVQATYHLDDRSDEEGHPYLMNYSTSTIRDVAYRSLAQDPSDSPRVRRTHKRNDAPQDSKEDRSDESNCSWRDRYEGDITRRFEPDPLESETEANLSTIDFPNTERLLRIGPIGNDRSADCREQKPLHYTQSMGSKRTMHVPAQERLLPVGLNICGGTKHEITGGISSSD
ncbi:hypothetical protein QAD02_007716, partial [Eretmocerus hayati]